MTKGKRKKRARHKALKKFKESLKGSMNKAEHIIFCAAFNMGWKEGKKRQRQITHLEERRSDAIPKMESREVATGHL